VVRWDAGTTRDALTDNRFELLAQREIVATHWACARLPRWPRPLARGRALSQNTAPPSRFLRAGRRARICRARERPPARGASFLRANENDALRPARSRAPGWPKPPARVRAPLGVYWPPAVTFSTPAGIRGMKLLLVCLFAGTCAAQSAALQFEVASVKASNGGPQGVWNEGSHERLRMLNMTLKSIIAESYAVKDHAVFGPSWIASARFEIIAKISPETARLPEKERDAAMQVMTQNLLAGRFKLEVHRETREMPVYALIPAKGGLKIAQSGPPSNDWVRAAIGRGALKARQMPMAQLLSILGGILDREVLDETGIPGVFDIALEWAPDETVAAQEKPSLFTALQE
jgi:uncharacterized protein (TIGR03435 family)